MTEYSKLPSHLALLFRPRPPLLYTPPLDISPEKRRTAPISGVSQYLDLLNTKDENYVPSESWLQVQLREKRQKAEENRKRLAYNLEHWDPHNDLQARGDPYSTLFIARLSYEVTEDDLRTAFAPFGAIERVRVVRDSKSGKSRGYAFICFEREDDMKNAYSEASGMKIKGRPILVDVERGKTVKSWKPRKLGGGLGGRHYTKRFLLAGSRNSDRDRRGNYSNYSGNQNKGHTNNYRNDRRPDMDGDRGYQPRRDRDYRSNSNNRGFYGSGSRGGYGGRRQDRNHDRNHDRNYDRNYDRNRDRDY